MSKVSILLPTYNRPKYFECALRSALAQTFTNIEVVVCDDSSNDATKQIADDYLLSYKEVIKYYKNDKTLGAIDNFHKCYDLASGEYINYLMDDDLFHPEKIRQMICFMGSDPDISLVASYRQLINDNNETLGDREFNRKIFEVDTVVDGAELGDIVLKNLCNYIGEPTSVLFRRRALSEKFGVYDGKQAMNNVDVASWLNLLKGRRAVYMPQPLSFLRIHVGQQSNNLANELNGVADWIDIVVNCRSDGFLQNDTDYYKCMHNLYAVISGAFQRVLDVGLTDEYQRECLGRLCSACQLLPFAETTLLEKVLPKMASLSRKEVGFDVAGIAKRVREKWREWKRAYLSELIGQRPVIIWGAGSGGRRTLEMLKEVGVCVQGFIDNDYRKLGDLVSGVTVYPGTVLNSSGMFPVRPYIIIGSAYGDEIQAELLEMGYKSKDDVLAIFERGNDLLLI